MNYQISKVRKLANSLSFTFRNGLCLKRLCWQHNRKHFILYAMAVLLVLLFILFSTVHTSSLTSSSSFSSTFSSFSSSSSSSSITQSSQLAAKAANLIKLLKSRSTHRDVVIGGFARHIGPHDPREFVRILSDLLIICHPDWRGIRAATYGQEGPIVEVPGILNDEHRDRLTDFIKATGVKKVVINGVPPNFIPYSKHLKEVINDIDVYFIFHGTLVQHTLAPDEAVFVDQLIEGQQQGYIKRIGFVKSGVANFISTLGTEAHTVSNFQRPAPPTYGVRMTELDNRIHIGVFGDGGWIKNTIVQLAAACMVENAIVHVIQLPAAPYLRRCRNKIMVHGMMPHDRFRNLVGQMDINLYISLSESYPMTVLESLVADVPCLTSYTNGYLEKDDVLKHYLIARGHDNPDLIQQQIKDVLEHREELMPRIRYLLHWLNENAQAQWDYFLGRSTSLVTPKYNLPRKRVLASPSPLSLVKVATDDKAEWPKPVVCFCTYELGSVTPGGTGVVVEAMVLALTEEGFEVVILGDMGKDTLEKWKQRMIQEKRVPSNLISVYQLEAIAPLNLNEIHPNLFITKAQQFADGLKALHRKKPFDVVEFHEYAGTSLEAVRLLGTPDSYLPPSVKVVLRVHGSLQLIDTAEAGTEVIKEMNNGARQAMYLMELMSMQYADRLLFPSESIKDLYVRAYRLTHPERFLVAPPPMKKVLGGFPKVRRVVQTHALEFLVFGKLQLVKGTDLIIQAAVSLFRKHPSLPINFVFVGLNMMCSSSKTDCLDDYIPLDLKDKFEFRPRVDRTELAELVKTAHVGVLASRFETFCMAAHELYTLGLPLVISDIPAFRDYFNQENAFVFKSGDVASLESALLEAASSSSIVRKSIGMTSSNNKAQVLQNELPAIDYGDSTLVYHQLGDPSISTSRLLGYSEFELASRDIYVDQILRITEQL